MPLIIAMATHDTDHQSHSPSPSGSKKVISPLPGADSINAAAELVRKRINEIFGPEPDAKEEIAEAKAAGTHRSKHQEFMYRLSTSGKSLAQIQTEWHEYYVNLPDHEKHEVWQEFYAAHDQTKRPSETTPETPRPLPKSKRTSLKRPAPQAPAQVVNVADLKQELLQKVSSRSRKATHHIQSLLFGLGMGSLVMLILMFGFFNQRFIAPFMTPSRVISNTPIILNPNDTTAGPEPRIIIPKINVDVPAVYDESSIEEAAVQRALERGVLHYATTPNPGEKGNAVFFGHSSNNIFNRGQYKFAFLLLKSLEPGDTFIIHYDSVRYVYKVFEKRIVAPTEVSVLNPIAGKAATATLITCDPPGRDTNRLVVVGEQISPDPSGNAESSALKPERMPEVVPSNAPSLWSRLTDWF